MPRTAGAVVRVPPPEAERLRGFAKRLHIDDEELFSGAPMVGAREVALDETVKRLQRGERSAWRVARAAGLTLLDLTDELQSRRIPVPSGENLFNIDLDLRVRRGGTPSAMARAKRRFSKRRS